MMLTWRCGVIEEAAMVATVWDRGVSLVGVVVANAGGEMVATVDRKWMVVGVEKGGFAEGAVGSSCTWTLAFCVASSSA